jgi:predicted GIY-YIG superfamily endonuclease
MSADFPNEAARCQRFLSARAQSNFEPCGQNGPAPTRPPCYLMQNTRSKDRVRGTNSVKRAVAQLGRAPGSGPGGRGFKSHQPDFNHRKLKEFYCYVLRSEKTGPCYVRSCENWADGIRRHNTGQSKAPKHGTPWVLIHSESFASRSEAATRAIFQTWTR